MLAIVCGVGISLLNIAIHGLLTVATVRVIRLHTDLQLHTIAVMRVIATMVIAAAILMAAHLIEVWVWSYFYQLLGVTPDVQEDFTFAFVNYTTLGYGNILPMAPWQVLGPITSMNGVLLFGWSTAVLFQVLFVTSHHLGIKY